MNLETIVFENNTLKIIDQNKLPQKLVYLTLSSLDEVWSAIQQLAVRGAPAIGVTAAYGMYVHARNLAQKGQLTLQNFQQAADYLKSARPTAVNLFWAIDEMLSIAADYESGNTSVFLEQLKSRAIDIHNSDRETCRAIGENGAGVLRDNSNVLTHCNAGALATAGQGTALSVIYSANRQGKHLHVYVDETRPRGQGARLTYWELQQNEIPATLLADNMAATLMKDGKIDFVVVGADRIAANGDVANKIGTYSVAVNAHYHGIPFFVAAPLSTFDMNTSSGDDIIIEMRHPSEILDFWHIPDSDTYNVYNPAFDVTPHYLISGIITEKGTLYPPFTNKISELFNSKIKEY